MPRVNIPVSQLTQSGIAPPAQVTADPTNDHEVITSNNMFLEVQNVGTTTAQTITFVTPGTVAGLAIEDLIISIPASSTRMIGPLDVGTFNNATGKIDINVDSADLRIRAYKL